MDFTSNQRETVKQARCVSANYSMLIYIALLTLIFVLLYVFLQPETILMTASVNTKEKYLTTSDYSAYIHKELVSSLREKLNIKTGVKILNNLMKPESCKEQGIRFRGDIYDDTCKATTNCLKTSLPVDLSSRIEALTSANSLQAKYQIVIHQMRARVNGSYEVAVLHGLSSNHFDESLAMLAQLQHNTFPLLKNFTLIVYDLGLEPLQLKKYEAFCKCRLLPFPFRQLPRYFGILKVCAWKVFIIAAHYENAEVTIWADASVEVLNGSGVVAAINKTKIFGIQQTLWHLNAVPNPHRTFPQMFEFFGDSPCAHLHFPQMTGGLGFYHREPLVRHAVISPWVRCAADRDCIMPLPFPEGLYCRPAPPRTIGVCHRNDQAALSIIMAKLFREKIYNFVTCLDFEQTGSFFRYNRDHRIHK